MTSTIGGVIYAIKASGSSIYCKVFDGRVYRVDPPYTSGVVAFYAGTGLPVTDSSQMHVLNQAGQLASEWYYFNGTLVSVKNMTSQNLYLVKVFGNRYYVYGDYDLLYYSNGVLTTILFNATTATE